MPTVTVERTYLRLEQSAAAPSEIALPDGVVIEEAEPCTVPRYRRLYAEVGAAYHWRDRLQWSDARLSEHLALATVRVWVLRDTAGDGGFFELVREEEPSVEIAYFGLLPSRHGRGLGRALLERAIAEAFHWGAIERLAAHVHARCAAGAA